MYHIYFGEESLAVSLWLWFSHLSLVLLRSMWLNLHAFLNVQSYEM